MSCSVDIWNDVTGYVKSYNHTASPACPSLPAHSITCRARSKQRLLPLSVVCSARLAGVPGVKSSSKGQPWDCYIFILAYHSLHPGFPCPWTGRSRILLVHHPYTSPFPRASLLYAFSRWRHLHDFCYEPPMRRCGHRSHFPEWRKDGGQDSAWILTYRRLWEDLE